MIIARHQPQLQLPSPVVGDQQVPHDHQLKLLSVLFDDQLSYKAHLRQVSLRANSCQGLLREASKYLSTGGRIMAYCGFMRPLLEYVPLSWMGAALTHLHKLIATFSAHHRPRCDFPKPCRHATALSFLYKLLCMSGTDQLTAMIPPLQPSSAPVRSRSNHRVQARHAFQLLEQLPNAAPNFLRRAFQYCIVDS